MAKFRPAQYGPARYGPTRPTRIFFAFKRLFGPTSPVFRAGWATKILARKNRANFGPARFWSSPLLARPSPARPARLPALRTTHKILQPGIYWPTLFKDFSKWVKHCDRYQRMGNINKRKEMPLKGIMVVQIFLCMGDRLHGTFPTFIWKFVHSTSCGL